MVDAKVDIRKLQLLNDRIAQVLDALGQVRFSVHGLTHTGAPIGQPFTGGPFQTPMIPYGVGQPISPFTQPGWSPGLVSPMAGYGLQHTAYNPYFQQGYLPFAQGFQGASPLTGWTGVPGWPGGGLYHTPDVVDQIRASEPSRILQTFPFCLAPPFSVTGW